MKKDDVYTFDYNRPQSIGRVKPFYGNFGIYLRAYTYIRSMGPDGLKAVTEYAVLNANYMMRRLRALLSTYHITVIVSMNSFFLVVARRN